MAHKILMEFFTELPLCSSARIAVCFEGRLLLCRAEITLVKSVCLLMTLDNCHVYPPLGIMEPKHYICICQGFRQLLLQLVIGQIRKSWSGFKIFPKEIALRSMFLAPARCLEIDIEPHVLPGSIMERLELLGLHRAAPTPQEWFPHVSCGEHCQDDAVIPCLSHHIWSCTGKWEHRSLAECFHMAVSTPAKKMEYWENGGVMLSIIQHTALQRGVRALFRFILHGLRRQGGHHTMQWQWD